MGNVIERRRAIRTLGLGLAAGLLASEAVAAPEPVRADTAGSLKSLVDALGKAPRRRDFKTVPMVLDHEDLWDHEALGLLLAYGPKAKQVWDATAIEGPWLNLVRNSTNAQVYSFKHPDYLPVVACHGSAQVALYDQAMWDKYRLTTLAGDEFATNTLIVEKPGNGDNRDFEDPKGVFSPAGNTIPALMRRGTVFTACHNAIWEQAEKLIAKGINPDKLSHDAMTAELTNHLIPGVVLTPGAVATILELQLAGYQYIK